VVQSLTQRGGEENGQGKKAGVRPQEKGRIGGYHNAVFIAEFVKL